MINLQNYLQSFASNINKKLENRQKISSHTTRLQSTHFTDNRKYKMLIFYHNFRRQNLVQKFSGANYHINQ